MPKSLHPPFRTSIRRYMMLPIFFCCLSVQLAAQDLPLRDGWKFSPGDKAEWPSPSFNDSGWAPIKVGATWESQGYPGYDGVGWYRVHVVIPSSIKERAFLKEKLC